MMAFRHGEIVEVQRSDQLLRLEWKLERYAHVCDYISPCFYFCNGTWIMRVYQLSQGLTFSLRREDNGTPKTLNVRVIFKQSKGVLMTRNVEQIFSTEKPIWRANDFCRATSNVMRFMLEMEEPVYVREDLGYSQLPQEPQVLNLRPDEPEEEIRHFIEERESSGKEGLNELQSSLLNLLKSEEDCDIVIKVQGKEFRAHRNILRTRSPVFHAMFAHDMVEKQKGAITMEDCDPGNFPDFLEHIYTGSVAMISAKNVFSLFESSDKYDFKTLKKECSKFIKENMTVASFCNVIMLGVRHNEKELIDCGTKFFCRNSVDIVKTSEWQVFLHENTTVGNELLIKLLSKHESIFRNST